MAIGEVAQRIEQQPQARCGVVGAVLARGGCLRGQGLLRYGVRRAPRAPRRPRSWGGARHTTQLVRSGPVEEHVSAIVDVILGQVRTGMLL